MEPTAGLAQTSLVQRYFTTPGVDPLDEVEWVRRDAWPRTGDEKMDKATEGYFNPGILVPAFWRQNDLDVTSKLYLSKADPVERKSVRRLIERVWAKITLEAMRAGYVSSPVITGIEFLPDFPNFGGLASEQVNGSDPFWDFLREDNDAAALYAEGCYLAVHQMAAFNSPVWFNVGRDDRIQQVSACYILRIDDNTASLTDANRRNAYIFKYGSGAGYNLSFIRGDMEPLSTGGVASGPLSFRRMFDATNGTFKSGGMTRRAAELVCMDDDHPNLVQFIEVKPREEERQAILIKNGVNLTMGEEGERNLAECTAYQNANMSVRLTNRFMRKVTGEDDDPTWRFVARVTGEPVGEPQDARALFQSVADAAWKCADPGVQYHDHFNDWHTTPMIDGEPSPIRSTNPCGEYASNDDTSCNLASINLVPFIEDGPDEETITTSNLPTIEEYRRFKVEDFRHTVDTMIVAMDVLVELSDFPDDPERGGQGKFRHYTKRLRQLGLGYCNLGGALMTQCIPYDSEEGRDWGAAVAALMTGRAYRKSAELAQRMGAFHYFGENREPMHGVINKHISHLRDVSTLEDGHSIWFAAEQDWMDARDRGLVHGYRNAQASVLAPTGSISYLMGCDSTGVEPVFDKVTLKILAGGGEQIMVADCVQHAAQLLGGYSDENLAQMAAGDFSCIAEEDRTIFHGANEISVEGHILMLGRIQPFISGGISKTVNMPERATVQDIVDAYLLAWRQGVKNVAIYRNNSKVRQVLHSYKPPEEAVPVTDIEALQALETKSKFIDDRIAAEVDPRRRMPRTRKSITHKISIRAAAGREHEGYVHVGFYPDGGIGEFFIEGFGKSGSFTLNALGQWATDFSIAIQYGVPFDVLIRKAAYTSDETGGVVVPDPHGEPLVIRTCESVIDYIARYLASVSGDEDLCEELGVMTPEVKERKGKESPVYYEPGGGGLADVTAVFPAINGHARETVIGPECSQCGQRMFRSGACWACSCGNTTGCG
jgi:ribonucleoside-diphosphate reductase alpha chain